MSSVSHHEDLSATPGWSSDCARWIGESATSKIWNNCVYVTAPFLGPTGNDNQFRDFWKSHEIPALHQSGTATTDPSWTHLSDFEEGKTPGYCIQFDDHSSAGSHYGFTDDSELNIGNSISLAIWVQVDDPLDGRNNHIINRKNSNPGTVGVFKQGNLNSWTFALRDTNGTAHIVVDPDTATPGWHLIVATYNKQSQNLFIDGVLKASLAGTFDIDTTPYDGLWIGAHPTSPDANSFVGWLAFVAIWNRCLSLAEVWRISADPHCLFKKRSHTSVLSSESTADVSLLLKQMHAETLFVGVT